MRYIFFIWIFLFSFFVNSQEKPIQDNQQQIEEVMKDSTNRLILSLFGHKALDAFNVDKKEVDFSVLENYSEEELIKLTAPFYKDNYKKFIFYGLVSVMVISFVLLIIYYIFLFVDGVSKSQVSGAIFGDNTTTIYFIIKGGLALLLIFPFYYPYNVVQIGAFKIAGYSNLFVREVNDLVINNQPRYYPTLKLPASDAKVLETSQIIQFLTCAKLDTSVRAKEINFHFYPLNDLLITEASVGSCYLKMQAGIDTGTYQLIESNKKIKDLVNVDYLEIQKGIHKNLFTVILDKANNASNVLAAPLDTVRSNSQTFNKYLGTKTTEQEDLVFWEKNCGEILNFNVSTTLSSVEKKEYLYLSSRCLSYEVAKILAYPTSESDIGRYLKTSNYLKDNQVELCSHNYNTKPEIRTAISEIGGNTYAKTTLKGGSKLESSSVEDCVIAACSNLQSGFSNAFICANAVNILNEHVKNDFLSDSGFLGMGATMYSYFTGVGVSESSKVMFNNFKADYIFTSKEINQPKTSEIIFSIKLINNAKPNNDERIHEIYTSIGKPEIASMRPLFIDNEREKTALSTSEGGMDILGFSRFSVCIRNPISYAEGQACSSVPEEMHKFGMNILNYGFFLKATTKIMSLGLATPQGLRYGKEYGGKIVDTTKKQYSKIERRINPHKVGKEKPSTTKDVENGVDSGNSKLKKAQSYFYNLIIPAALVGGFAGFFEGDYYEVDEFGGFDNAKYQQFLMDGYTGSGVMLGIIAVSNTSNIVGDFMQGCFSFLIILGAFMAFVLPLIPFVMWILVIISWVVALLAVIFMLPIWLPLLASPAQTHYTDFDKNSIAVLKTLLFKAPMLAIGLMVAWILSNTLIAKVMSIFSFDNYVSVIGNAGFSSSIDAVIAFVILVVMFIILTGMTLSLIENFEEFALSWLVNNPSTDAHLSDKSAGLFGQIKQIRNLTKTSRR